MYRWVAQSVEGFVQQLAVSYVARGYRFYVTGRVPEHKRDQVDQKLMKRYGVDASRAERCRRRAAGRSTVHYLRHGELFVLLATHGAGRFMEDEAAAMRDFSREPLKCFGYSIAFRGGHASVRIEIEEAKRLRALLAHLAVHRRTTDVVQTLTGIPYERYAPVRGQLLGVLREVNRVRKAAGYEQIQLADLWRRGPDGRVVPWLRRFVFRPFEPPAG